MGVDSCASSRGDGVGCRGPRVSPGAMLPRPFGRPSRASPVPRPNRAELRACERIGLKISDCEFQMHKSLACRA